MGENPPKKGGESRKMKRKSKRKMKKMEAVLVMTNEEHKSSDKDDPIITEGQDLESKNGEGGQGKGDTKKKEFVSAGEKILAIEAKAKVDFSVPEGGLKKKEKKLVRFPLNPEANWGPKPRASGY